MKMPPRRAAVTTGCIAAAATALALVTGLSSDSTSAAPARLTSNRVTATSNGSPTAPTLTVPSVLPPTVPGSLSPTTTSPSAVALPPAADPAPARQNAATVVPVANTVNNNTARSGGSSKPKAVNAPAGCSAGAVGSWAQGGDIATTLFNEINAERRANCLPALGRSSQLNSSAHAHNLAMASSGDFAHQVPGEASLGARITATGYHWTSAGENIAWGSFDLDLVRRVARDRDVQRDAAR